MRRPDANIFVLMKPLALSKSRLKDVLSDEERRVLSLAMLARTIRAARDAVAATHVTVVGGDEAVRRLAVLEGVSWREEPATGLNASLSRLLRQPPPNEQDLFVYLPADLPLIEPADVDQLVALTAPSHVVIAPDRWRSGTNALVIPAGADFTPALGRSSFENHKTAAVRAGLTSRVCESPGLLLDVDTPADLDELLSRKPEWWDEANETAKRLKIDPGIRV